MTTCTEQQHVRTSVGRGERRALLALGASLCLLGGLAAQTAPRTNVGEGAKTFDGSPGVPIHPDQKAELKMKIEQPFTAVSVGDMLEFQPFSKLNDPRVQSVVKVLQHADITTADFENEIQDFDMFGHYGGNLAPATVADDFKSMGIDFLGRANNKSVSSPGIWEDLYQAHRVGIPVAGAGHTMAEARMPRFHTTPQGIVGFVSVWANGGTDACCEGGKVVRVTPAQLAQVKAMKDAILARRSEVEVPVPIPPPDPANMVNLFDVTFFDGSGTPPERRGRGGSAGPGGGATSRGGFGGRGDAWPGAAAYDGFSTANAIKNSLDLTLYHGVTTEQMQQLRAIAGEAGTNGDLHAFGTQFRVMAKPGEHSFDMNPDDLKAILTQIKTGKEASDFLMLNMHWHQNRYAFQHYSYDHFPADFEIQFAHLAIDEGVDMFVAQGVHTIKGVEIYKGKPIFYGVSNFAFQSALMPSSGGRRDEAASPVSAPDMVDGIDLNSIVGEHQTQGFWQLKPNLESLMVSSHYVGGKLAEVLIYPLDLGQTPRPSSQVGIPRTPSPAVAAKILAEVVEYSKPFGTKIDIENGVGIIRIPPADRR